MKKTKKVCLLPGEAIISEILARIFSLDTSINSGYLNLRLLAKIHARRLELRNLLSWIEGQNQLIREDERTNLLAEELLEGPGSFKGEGPSA